MPEWERGVPLGRAGRSKNAAEFHYDSESVDGRWVEKGGVRVEFSAWENSTQGVRKGELHFYGGVIIIFMGGVGYNCQWKIYVNNVRKEDRPIHVHLGIIWERTGEGEGKLLGGRSLEGRLGRASGERRSGTLEGYERKQEGAARHHPSSTSQNLGHWESVENGQDKLVSKHEADPLWITLEPAMVWMQFVPKGRMCWTPHTVWGC